MILQVLPENKPRLWFIPVEWESGHPWLCEVFIIHSSADCYECKQVVKLILRQTGWHEVSWINQDNLWVLEGSQLCEETFTLERRFIFWNTGCLLRHKYMINLNHDQCQIIVITLIIVFLATLNTYPKWYECPIKDWCFWSKSIEFYLTSSEYCWTPWLG